MKDTDTNSNAKVYRNISELHNWDKNPRGIKQEDFERLKRQIQKLGQYKPVICTPEGKVLGGNMRIRAYRELGISEVWVSIVNPKTEAEEVEYALSDNDKAGYYEEDALAELLTKNQLDLPLEDYKLDLGEGLDINIFLSRFAPDDMEEDETPEVDENNTESVLGEVYQLGRHRVMCGDATNPEHVKTLMGDVKADMVFTDPPYNVDYTGKTKDALKIDNDKFEDDTAFYNFLFASFQNMARHLKTGGVAYICHADSEGLNFRKAFQEAGFDLKQCIIWNKDILVMGRQDYHWKHEPILYGWLAGGAHKWYGNRKQTTVWDVSRPTVSKDYPTMKPIRLIARSLSNSTKGDDVVLDLFGGSGSTLIACEQMKRTCFTMELDPKYCDVIRKRYTNFLSNKGE